MAVINLNYKYKAFISYRHTELDMKIAGKLQKKLETFSPPRNLKSHWKHWRIFRDVTELNTANSLSDEINTALDESEYFIAICSKEYKESKWCLMELQYFLKIHDYNTEKIIVLLSDGTPEESFPSELKRTAVSVENGSNDPSINYETIEPLAAVLTGNSTKESLKKLNSEILRIEAKLMEVSYDDIFQRFKRRKRQKITAVISSIAVAGIAFSVYSGVMLYQIKNQRDTIQNQANNLIIENARHNIAESMHYMDNNDLFSAVNTVLKALPTDNDELPVLPEAEYLLAEEIGAFEPQSFIPNIPLVHRSNITDLVCAEDGRIIVSQDSKYVYCWDANDGKLLNQFKFSGWLLYPKNREYKIDGIHNTVKGVYSATTMPTFSELRHNYAKDGSESSVGDNSVYLNSSSNEISKIGVDGNIVWTTPLRKDFKTGSSGFGSEFLSSDCIIRATISSSGDHFAEIISKETGEIQKTININDVYDYFEEHFSFHSPYLLAYEGNRLYYQKDTLFKGEIIAFDIIKNKAKISNNEDYLFGKVDDDVPTIFGHCCYKDNIYFTRNTDTMFSITKVNDSDGNIIWEKNYPDKDIFLLSEYALYHPEIVYFEKKYTEAKCDIIAVISREKVMIINAENGNLIHQYNLPTITSSYYSKNGFIFLIDSSGDEIFVSVNNADPENYSSSGALIHTFRSQVNRSSFSSKKYVTAGEKSNIAYINQIKNNSEMYEIEYSDDIELSDSLFGRDKSTDRYIFINAYKKEHSDDGSRMYCPAVIDKQEEKVVLLEDTWFRDRELFIHEVRFIDDNHVLVNIEKKDDSSDIYRIYNLSNGQKTDLDIEPEARSNFLFSTKDYTYIRINNAYFALDAEGNCTEIKFDDNMSSAAAGNSFNNKIITYMMKKNGDSFTKNYGIYDFDTESYIPIVFDMLNEGNDGLKFKWINKNKCAFLLAEKIYCIDTDNGQVISVDDVSDLPTDIVDFSCFGTDGEYAVICSDNTIYFGELGKGLTGKSVIIPYEYSLTDVMIDITMSPDNSFLSVKLRNSLYIIDYNDKVLRYNIPNGWYCNYELKKVYFSNPQNEGKLSYYPLYDTKQLIAKANELFPNIPLT